MTDVPKNWDIAVAVIVALVVGTAFFFVTRSLRRGVGIQTWPARVLLGGLWILSYFLLVNTVAYLLGLAGVKGEPVDSASGVVVVVGIIAMVVRLLTWRRPTVAIQVASPAAPFSPISGDIATLPSFTVPAGAAAQAQPAAPAARSGQFELLKCAYDGFAMPVRRPVLFVPFIFYMLALTVALQALGVQTEQASDFSQTGVLLQLILVSLAFVPVFTLALETTSHMAGDAEAGKPVSLFGSLKVAWRRLPRAFAVTILYTLGIIGGFLLFIVPGIVWSIRWIFGTQAVMLGNAGVRDAFRVSDRLTRGRWWQFFLLFFAIGAAIRGLNLVLDAVPAAGRLAAGWLEFAWLTIAATLAYVRAGGPVKPD